MSVIIGSRGLQCGQPLRKHILQMTDLTLDRSVKVKLGPLSIKVLIIGSRGLQCIIIITFNLYSVLL